MTQKKEPAASSRSVTHDLIDEVARLQRLRRDLCEIGAALSAGFDLDELLNLIVLSARRIAVCDAGSLYVIEKKGEERLLRFTVAQCESREIPYKSFTMPLDAPAAAAAAARTGKPLRFEDAYRIPPETGVSFNRSFDESTGYRTKSMLVVPMTDYRNEVVGVIQLINKKPALETPIPTPAEAERVVLPFTDEDEEVLSGLAPQAGIAIERARLYLEIERLLRGFVESSAVAIEARDETTSGHSRRIASYMVAFAKRISRTPTGPYAHLTFTPGEIRQIFYAATLHDVGKIGVPEEILTKANKLTDARLEAIAWRLRMAKTLDPARAAEIDEDLAFVRKANVPGFLPDEGVERIRAVGRKSFRTPEGEEVPFLDTADVDFLVVQRGNLTAEERAAMEYHIVHTATILNRIPWTRDLARVPEIAASHHEMIDGSGYPNRLKGDRIPVEGKMLVICDIFEALTAQDRPYKPPMSSEKALGIIEDMARKGKVDAELFRIFKEEKVYEVISDEDRRNFTKTSEEILALE